MLSNLKQKIPFLKDKTLDEYNGTILMPSFNMIELTKNASLVGLDIKTYKSIIQNKKKSLSMDSNYRIMKLINYISRVVFEEEFIKKATMKMILVANYGTFNCDYKSFNGNIIIDNQEYKFALKIGTKNITYAYSYNSEKQRGEFRLEKNQFHIKYNTKKEQVISEQDKKIYNIQNDTILEIYDSFKYQQFNYHKIQKYNYYVNNGSQEKKVDQINPSENYTKDEYIWRCPDSSIMKKLHLKYQYPKCLDNNLQNMDKFYIGKNISPNNCKLPTKGTFYDLSFKIFQDYYNNRCDIETVWEHALTYSKH